MPHRWYVVHAYSGFENKVAGSIREQAEKKGLSEEISEVIVPTEEVVEVRRGSKVNTERKFFPGYVLVKMDLSDETWHLIKNTAKVTGFLGGGGRGKPVPISDAEANRILKQVQEGVDRPKPSISFEVGEQVRVSDGPFASFNGTVEEVDDAILEAWEVVESWETSSIELEEEISRLLSNRYSDDTTCLELLTVVKFWFFCISNHVSINRKKSVWYIHISKPVVVFCEFYNLTITSDENSVF